jgi:hypothetical protein
LDVSFDEGGGGGVTRIVTTNYRYKRPTRRKKALALAVPEIVAIPRKRGRKVVAPEADTDAATSERDAQRLRAEPPANDDRKSSIVTARRRGRRFADVPDVTPEEHRRVGDLADALWRDMVRRISDKDQS